MFANDQYGCCVWAGAAHETMLLAREAGNTVIFTDDDVLGDYSAETGFKKDDPATDNGTDVQAAAAYRQKVGILDSAGNRHKIAGYVGIQPGNVTNIFYASYLFGAVGIGLNLPTSALLQAQNRQPWDVVDGSPNDGGHYVPLIGRRADGMLVTVSWGMIQLMTQRFFETYCDEAIAYLSTEDLVNQKSPEGFAYDDLQGDLKSLAA